MRFADPPTEEEQSLADRLRRSLSWARRAAAAERYSQLRFVFLWIALNSLYGRRHYADRTLRDRDDFRDFVERIERIDAEPGKLKAVAKRIEIDALEIVANPFLHNEYWRGERRDFRAAQTGVGTEEPARLLNCLFPRLLLLRNQIFHGSASEGTGRQEWALKPALRVLEALLSVFIRLMLRRGTLSEWSPVPYPGWGTPQHPFK